MEHKMWQINRASQMRHSGDKDKQSSIAVLSDFFPGSCVRNKEKQTVEKKPMTTKN